MSTRWLIWGLGFLVFGCAKPEATTPPPPPPKHVKQVENDPLYEQIRSGRFQFRLALDDLAEAVNVVTAGRQGLKPADKAVLEEALEALDGAGRRVAELAEDPPDISTFEAQKLDYLKWRERAINEGNDAVFELKTAASAIANLSDFIEGQNRTALVEAHRALRRAIETVESGITEMDGMVEPYAPAELD